MSFDTDLPKEGIGRVLALEVSSTNFASLSYALAEKAGVLDGTNQYSSRVLRVGAIRRGFGAQRVATAAGTEVVLDNVDGALDFFLDRANLDALSQLRFRVRMFLYAPGTSSFTNKLLGEYVLSEWPRFDGSELTLVLGDEVLGSLSQAIPLPTLADWQAVGSAATNPLIDGFGRPDVLDVEGSVPVPLAFGEDWVQAMPHLIPIGTVDAAYQNKLIIPICCTTDTGAFDEGEITSLRITLLGNSPDGAPRIVDVPLTNYDPINQLQREIWRVERSPVITKLGVDFEVIYLVVAADLGVDNWSYSWLRGGGVRVNGDPVTYSYDSPQYALEWTGGYPPSAIYKMRSYVDNDPSMPQYANIACAVIAWHVKGVPLSAITQQTSAVQHAVDVITDLVTSYSQRAISVDATMAARVKAATPLNSCAGVVQPWWVRAGGTPPSMRQVLTQIAQSADLDIFVDWDGEVSFSAALRDYTTATQYASLPAFTSEHFSSVEQWMPGEGERHAVYNRIYLEGGKPYPAEMRDIPFQGPYDMPSGTGGIDLESRVIEGTLQQGWRPWRQQSQNPLYWRTGLDTEARPMVRFVTDISALRLDLGDFLRLTWRRGSVAALFDDVVFQVEQLVYAPSGDEVEIVCVWQEDTTTELGYLLDDETLLVRSKGVMSGSAYLEGSSGSLVEFDGTIDLVSMGVQVGDILVVRDPGEAADEFELNWARRIVSVNSAFSLNVSEFDDTGATIANADWYICRGATTYPTAVSDPTNYPDGGEMFGKMVNTSGEYSNASPGLKLLGG